MKTPGLNYGWYFNIRLGVFINHNFLWSVQGYTRHPFATHRVDHSLRSRLKFWRLNVRINDRLIVTKTKSDLLPTLDLKSCKIWFTQNGESPIKSGEKKKKRLKKEKPSMTYLDILFLTCYLLLVWMGGQDKFRVLRQLY